MFTNTNIHMEIHLHHKHVIYKLDNTLLFTCYGKCDTSKTNMVLTIQYSHNSIQNRQKQDIH